MEHQIYGYARVSSTEKTGIVQCKFLSFGEEDGYYIKRLNHFELCIKN